MAVLSSYNIHTAFYISGPFLTNKQNWLFKNNRLFHFVDLLSMQMSVVKSLTLHKEIVIKSYITHSFIISKKKCRKYSCSLNDRYVTYI